MVDRDFVRISFLPSYEQIDSVVHIGIPDCFRGDSGEREINHSAFISQDDRA